MSSLTDDETNIYDRQIRLWGIEAQQKMRASKILLAGHIGGTALEIAKNLVLAGVGSVCLSDNETITVSDFAGDFFSSQYNVDNLHSRSFAPLEGLRELNSNVHISNHVHTTPLSAEPSSFFQSFDFVLYFGDSLHEAMTINDKCRVTTHPISEHKLEYTRFSFIAINGDDALWIQDLISFSWTEKQEDNQKNTTTTKIPTQQTLTTSSISTFLPKIWTEIAENVHIPLDQLQDHKFIDTILHLWVKNILQSGKSVSPHRKIGMYHLLLLLCANSPNATNFGHYSPKINDIIRKKYIESIANSSIVGGVVAQEILKMLGSRHKPVVNSILFTESRVFTIDLQSLPKGDIEACFA